MKPKISRLYILALLTLVSPVFAKPPFQTPTNVGTWEELKDMGFSEWKISRYSYIGQMADGGSLGFLFLTELGVSFKLIAANGAYLTDDERALSIEQSFFISINNGNKGAVWFKVERDSNEEADLLEKFKTAVEIATGVESYDPDLLRIAIEHIESRKELSNLSRED